MNVDKLRNYISIVVIGDFHPDKITAEWLVEKGIVSEKFDQDKRILRLERNLSVFLISHNIEVLATRDRIQVTGLVDDQEEVITISLGILRLSEHSNLKGAGINAVLEFSFQSVEDGDKFGEFLISKDKWKEYFKIPSIYEVTLRDNADPKEIGYDKAINIRSIAARQSEEGKSIPSVRMSANYSFDVSTDEDCLSLMKNTTKYSDEFWSQADQIIADIK